MKLFLDDVRNPEECSRYMQSRIFQDNPIYLLDWTVVRNYKEFCKAVDDNVGVLTHVSFDHDLADAHYCAEMYEGLEAYERALQGFSNTEQTGKECAEYLVQVYGKQFIPLPTCYVHSMNPAGCERIVAVLKGAVT